MLRVIVCLTVLVLSSAAAEAQARPVLMRLCNDTPFAVGVAAAYDTNPSGGRRAEGWFRVEANGCLEGALRGVVGNSLALAAFSGTWQWPGGDGAFTYCLPADGFNTGVLDVPPCGEASRRVDFQTVRIAPYRAEWGEAVWRIGCSDLAGDAQLCEETPAARDGMAEPLRTVELCAFSPGGIRVATASRGTDGFWHVSGWQQVANEECAPVFRGHPSDGVAYWLAQAPGDMSLADSNPDGRSGAVFCVADGDFEVTATSERISDEAYCPPEAPHGVRFTDYHFMPNVSHYTAFFRRVP